MIIITAACLSAVIWYAWDRIFGNRTSQISQDAEYSVALQNALLNTRQLNAEVISLKVQLDAAQSKEKIAELKIQEFDATTALTKTTTDIAQTCTILKEVNEASSKSHESLRAIEESQITPLQNELKVLNGTVKSLTTELEEKTVLIDTFQPQLIAQQAEMALHKSSLEEVNIQIIELMNINQRQTKTIQTLQEEKETLISQIEELTDVLEKVLLTDPLSTKAVEIEPTTAPQAFFR
jgi:hypothetical protein